MHVNSFRFSGINQECLYTGAGLVTGKSLASCYSQ